MSCAPSRPTASFGAARGFSQRCAGVAYAQPLGRASAPVGALAGRLRRVVSGWVRMLSMRELINIIHAEPGLLNLLDQRVRRRFADEQHAITNCDAIEVRNLWRQVSEDDDLGSGDSLKSGQGATKGVRQGIRPDGQRLEPGGLSCALEFVVNDALKSLAVLCLSSRQSCRDTVFWLL